MKYIIFANNDYGEQTIYCSGVTSEGIPHFVFDIEAAGKFREEIAEYLTLLCNRLTPYYFITQEI